MSNKDSIGRIYELLNKIEDNNLRQIISGVFRVEISYRSADRVNFPRQRIKDIVDGVARNIESKSNQLNINEIPKD